MDSFEFNKIAGAVLASLVALLGISILSDMAFTPHKPDKPAYIIEGVVEEVVAAGPVETEKPIAFYLASASPDKGEAVFKKCAACHNAAPGGANGIGPNLHGIMGGPHASRAGFAYSASLGEMKGQPWTWDEMNQWLKNPKNYAAGNKMSFAGLSKPDERAAVMLWLNQQSANPMAVPAAPAEEVAEEPAADVADEEAAAEATTA